MGGPGGGRAPGGGGAGEKLENERIIVCKNNRLSKAYLLLCYETDEVTNTLVSPAPKKQNLNKDKVDINGKPMVVGSQNHYTLSWDLDQYRGIKADNAQIAKGFYFVDDYPEEALLPDDAGYSTCDI